MMPDNPQPTPPLPETIAQELRHVIMICVDHGKGIRTKGECEQAMGGLRQAIATALAQPLPDERRITRGTVISSTFFPESIEAAMKHYERAIVKMFAGASSSETIVSGPEKDVLVQAILTALAQARDDSSLRERCERLRRTVVYMTGPPDGRAFVPERYFQPGDLADDLQPPQEAAP